jgi:hypothetical protein
MSHNCRLLRRFEICRYDDFALEGSALAVKLSIISAGLLAIALTACGGGGSTPPTSTGTPAPTGTHRVTVTEVAPNSSASSASKSRATSGKARIDASTVNSNVVVLGDSANSQLFEPAVITVTDSNNNPVTEASAPTVTFNSGSNLELDPLNPPVASVPVVGWDVAFQFTNNAAPATSTLTASFSDGSTGTATIDTYDSFYLSCVSSINVSVSSGIAVNSSSSVDLSIANCTTPGDASSPGTVTFTNGYMVAAQPVLDQYGSPLPALATYLTAQPFVSQGTTLTPTQLSGMNGDIIQAPDSNGVQHKYMLVTTEPLVFLQLASTAGVFAF